MFKDHNSRIEIFFSYSPFFPKKVFYRYLKLVEQFSLKYMICNMTCAVLEDLCSGRKSYNKLKLILSYFPFSLKELHAHSAIFSINITAVDMLLNMHIEQYFTDSS